MSQPSLLAGGEIAQQDVQVSGRAQGFDQLALETGLLVNLQGRAVLFARFVVVPQSERNVSLAAMPVGLFFLEARLARQPEGSIEGAQGFLGLPKPQLAQGEVAQIVARRSFEIQPLTDGQRLLVIIHCLAEVPEIQVHAADVAEREAFVFLTMRRPLQFKRALVLFERATVITLLVGDQAQVVERGRFQLRVAEFVGNGNAVREDVGSLLVLALLPVNQPEMAERLPFLEAIAQLLFQSEGALKKNEGRGWIAEAFVTVADVSESDGLVMLVAGLLEQRQRALIFGECGARPLFGIELPRMREHHLAGCGLGGRRRLGRGEAARQHERNCRHPAEHCDVPREQRLFVIPRREPYDRRRHGLALGQDDTHGDKILCPGNERDVRGKARLVPFGAPFPD